MVQFYCGFVHWNSCRVFLYDAFHVATLTSSVVTDIDPVLFVANSPYSTVNELKGKVIFPPENLRFRGGLWRHHELSRDGMREGMQREGTGLGGAHP